MTATAGASTFVKNTKANSSVVAVMLDLPCLITGDLANVIFNAIYLKRLNFKAIDVCALNRCQHRCRSHNGQAICECMPGFELAYDQRSCIAKDGCTLNNGGCEQECIQTGNQHRCGCRQGFELNEDQRSCRGKFFWLVLKL